MKVLYTVFYTMYSRKLYVYVVQITVCLCCSDNCITGGVNVLYTVFYTMYSRKLYACVDQIAV